MKNIFIVNAHINSIEKENILISALLQLRKCKEKILIVSNSILSTKVLSLCDYYIYDVEDQLLPIDKTPTKWFADDKMSVHTYSNGNSFSIIKNLGIGLNFVKNLGFENFLTMEYDNIIDDKDLPKLNDMFEALSSKNAYFCKYLTWDLDWFESRIFSGKINFFLENVPLPKTLQEWYTTYPYSQHIQTLEYLYPIILQKHTSDLEFFNGSNEEYFPNSKIDINTSLPEVNIAYNSDDISQPVLFILGIGAEYKVTIDNVTIDTIQLSRGNWIRYNLCITDTTQTVKVQRGDVVKTFEVSLQNIDSYKTRATVFKL